MRFALVGPAFPLRGGIAQHTSGLARALHRDHQVLVATFSRQYPRLFFPGSRQRLAAAPPPGGVAAQPWLDSLNPWSWRRCGRRIARFEPDAVILQWWHPFFSPSYASLMRTLRRSWGRPLMLFCHNVYPHERMPGPLRWLEARLIGRVFSLADGFLVQSSELGREVASFQPRAPQRLVSHPIYDHFAPWDPGLSELSPSDREPARLLFFGKIRRYKGLEVLLEALGRLDGKLEFEATIAGEFYLDSRPLHRLADRLGLAKRIRWESRYLPDSEVPALFRSADLVVLPYLEATQSGVIPLAYQFEVPVIATSVGGLSEQVRDGKTGFLCPPGDAAALADAVLRYFAQRRQSEFRENIRRFRAGLSWQQVIDGILNLLEAIAGRGDSS